MVWLLLLVPCGLYAVTFIGWKAEEQLTSGFYDLNVMSKKWV